MLKQQRIEKLKEVLLHAVGRIELNFRMPLIAFIEEKAELCPRCGSFAVLHRKMYYSSPRPRGLLLL